MSTLIAFSELLWRDVKVEILLISWKLNERCWGGTFVIQVSFTSNWKYHFRLLLGGFLDVIWQVMECKAVHQVFDTLYSILKKRSKLSQKTDFLAHFERFFNYTLLRPPSYVPIFCQIKDLMVIHARNKFHQYSIPGSQVMNFQMFLWQCSIHEIASFGGGFLVLFSLE